MIYGRSYINDSDPFDPTPSIPLARAAVVPPRRINEIVLGKRSVTAGTAVRLAAALGTSERLWLDLQADYDLEEAHRLLGKAVDRIERIAA